MISKAHELFFFNLSYRHLKSKEASQIETIFFTFRFRLGKQEFDILRQLCNDLGLMLYSALHEKFFKILDFGSTAAILSTIVMGKNTYLYKYMLIYPLSIL